MTLNADDDNISDYDGEESKKKRRRTSTGCLGSIKLVLLNGWSRATHFQLSKDSSNVWCATNDETSVLHVLLGSYPGF